MAWLHNISLEEFFKGVFVLKAVQVSFLAYLSMMNLVLRIFPSGLKVLPPQNSQLIPSDGFGVSVSDESFDCITV